MARTPLDIAALLAHYRALHGDATMMADDDTPPADDKPADDDKGDAGKQDDPDDDVTDEERAALGDAGQRALDRMKERLRTAREQQAQDAADAAEARRLREESKTDQQRREEAERRNAETLATTTRELAQLKAALAAGLDHTMADRLKGSTDAELLADAKKLAEKFPAAGADTTTRTRRTTSDADKGGSGPGGGLSSDIRRAAGYA